ncbi:MAG: DUF4129 domain-containing protein, partial [Thermomicrobium sp.]|nr:DUF4129 domain-containing protein [Thermomicrobium sp.]
MLRRPDPLAIALALSAGAAETVPFAALVTWLVTVFGGDPSRVPSWPAIAATWLLAYLTARLVLGQTQDPTWARTIAVVGWIGWTLSWWTARAATPWAVLEFLPALVRLEAGAVGLLVLSALVWWRALGLASEPHPFQGGYLRWAVARDLGLGGGVVLAAVLSGGEAARAVWEFLAWAAPLLVLLRLATAALVQAEAVRLAYPAATSAGAWVLRSLVVAGGVLGVGALVSLLAGPALWPHIARPVFWFLTFLVAVLVTMMLALAVIVWTALRFLVWAVQALAGRGEPGPPPSPPAFPDLARPHEAVQSLALPSW